MKKFSGELANLDVMRAVAVTGVFVSHLMMALAGTDVPSTSLMWTLGQGGVTIFFVHTALVLMTSLERHRGAPVGETVRSFYIRRFWRIYPLAVVTIAVTVAMRPQKFKGSGDLLANLSLTQNLFGFDNIVGPTWTLPIEIQMYVLLPVFFYLFGKRHIGQLMAFWGITLLLALVQMRLTDRLNVVEYAPCFMGGVLAWKMSQRQGRAMLPGWLWIACLGVLSVSWCLVSPAYNPWNRWALCLALGTVIPYFRDVESKLLVTTAKIVAKYSYSIYLCHMALQSIFLKQNGMASGPFAWAGLAVAMVVVPFALYHLVEEPGIKVGKWMTAGMATPRPTHVMMMPAEVASPAMLAARLVSGQSESPRRYTFPYAAARQALRGGN